MVRLAIDEILEKKFDSDEAKTAYRLALETGINHGMLWKLRHNQVKTIRLDVIEKLCKALDCTPNDLLVIEEAKSESKKKAKS